jgi:RimJ/RimL family protein N-acetyltransferase
MTPAPTITTERLTLRGPVASDFEPMAAFYADPVRAAGFGGVRTRTEAWRWFASVIGHWHLRGFGFWTITDKSDGTVLGICGIWEPEGWPEPEIGWVVYETAEGRGIAYEAALAARAYAYDVWKMPALSSNIIPGNTRSIALAERLGAVFEREYQNVSHGTELLYRHPGPEALA